MMIRINLLPVRQAQKKEQGRQFIVLMVGTLIIAAAANAFWYSRTDDERARAQTRLDDLNREIAVLEKTIGEVNKLATRKKEIEEKRAVLQKLTAQKTGPVKVLDALATAIPKKVWLANFAEGGGAASLQGSAESNDDVSEFIRSLNNIVWSPKGMARVIERRRDGKNKVEVVADGTIDEFSSAETPQFFTNVELKGASAAPDRGVRFELTLNVQLAI